MKKKIVIKILVFTLIFIVTAGAAQAAYTTYISLVEEEAAEDDKDLAIENTDAAAYPEDNLIEDSVEMDVKNLESMPKKEMNISEPGRSVPTNESVKIGRPMKKNLDTSKVALSKEIEDVIRQKDNKNAERHITNYKKLLAGLDVPEGFRSVIEELLKKGHTPSDIFIAYEFLYENYGLISELEGLLEQKNAKKTWTEIFHQYSIENPEYVPGDFETGYLEGLLKDPGLAPDDITIADRLSQKGVKKFGELIELRKSGQSWKEIKSSLGVVNTEETLPRFSMTGAMVRKYMDETGLSEDEVMGLLVISGKLDRDENEVIQLAKKGEKKEEIFAQAYEEKYR